MTYNIAGRYGGFFRVLRYNVGGYGILAVVIGEKLYQIGFQLSMEGVHSMFLRKKNLKFFCCSFEKNVLLRMCIQQQMRMFSMSH